jgi:hypothetical protein
MQTVRTKENVVGINQNVYRGNVKTEVTDQELLGSSHDLQGETERILILCQSEIGRGQRSKGFILRNHGQS